MGTYTANYQLYMPTIGEQGWGELINGNYQTIDTTMAGLNTRMGTAESNITSLTSRMGTAETTITSNVSRIGTLETETDAMKEKVDAFEVNNGDIIATVNGFLFVKGTVTTETTDTVYATCSAEEINLASCVDSSNILSYTIPDYNITYGNPQKHTEGVYTRREDLSGVTNPTIGNTRTMTIYATQGSIYASATIKIFYKKTTDTTWTSHSGYVSLDNGYTLTITVEVGATYEFYHDFYWLKTIVATMPAAEIPAYYVKYATP